jgi:hypothetical protein
MSCKVEHGIGNSCEDVLRVGGVGRSFWVGYLSDLDTPFSTSQAADITSIDFGAYGGLYRFDGRKFSHQYSSPMAVAAGGNKSFTPTFIAKLLSKTTADDLTLKQLALADDIFIIADDNNGGFVILGAGNGLSVSGYDMSTGQTGDSDTSTSVTLTGSELSQPLRLSVPGAGGTLAYIESFEI